MTNYKSHVCSALIKDKNALMSMEHGKGKIRTAKCDLQVLNSPHIGRTDKVLNLSDYKFDLD